MNADNFGEFFKSLRIKKGLTLRTFCLNYHLDPGNISKLERGILTPPQDIDTLKKYASFLDIRSGSEEWHTFVDLAAAGSGLIPEDIMNEKKLVSKLPVVFRTLRRKKLTKEVLKELIDKIKEI
jgi:transcriptional regulator with XRE-family HTH domain